jgi:hypothetical protein
MRATFPKIKDRRAEILERLNDEQKRVLLAA